MAKNRQASNGAAIKVWSASFCILFVVAVFLAYAGESAMILELKDVQFFKAQVVSSSPLTIKLSGLAFHSSLAVQKVTTSQEGDTVHVLVYLTPVTLGRSGNFEYTLAIQSSVSAVTFGKENIPIWTRSVGITQGK